MQHKVDIPAHGQSLVLRYQYGALGHFMISAPYESTTSANKFIDKIMFLLFSFETSIFSYSQVLSFCLFLHTVVFNSFCFKYS